MSKNEIMKAKNTELNAQISYFCVKKGYSKEELASLIGICKASLYNKLRNPNSFTLGELRELTRLMKMDEEQILAIV